MNENNRVDSILNGLDQARPANPDETFVLKMEQMTESFFQTSKRVPRIKLIGIAASFAVLLIANVLLINQSNNAALSTNDNLEEVENYDYDLIPIKSLYYE